ncbi:O-antigen ligase [Nakamurella sp. PAMC28650]|uniref:O-antigen ligase family protein n=1 Tax=Nakamurella sp. PAMC28650 TaxID=2762325 RepID=UPI00164D5B81|nr:O-antigen ligase family protein [Nakamurella sp. PAMC28650]QNK80975.1 O-antigen ligase family protein [Nakamurella sp. PAMC28650]
MAERQAEGANVEDSAVPRRLGRNWILIALGGIVYFTAAGTALGAKFASSLTTFLGTNVDDVGLCLSGMALAAGILVVISPRLKGQTRIELAIVVELTIFVAFPITRLSGIVSRELLIFILITAVIALTGLIGSGAAGGNGRLPLMVMSFGLLAATVAFDSRGGVLLLLCRSVVPGVSCFFLARRMLPAGLNRVCGAIVALAAAQSVMAIAEPFVFPTHLWAPAALDSLGNVAPLTNAILGSAIERSQASLGHPLPLGFLLAVGLVLVLRVLPLTWLPKVLIIMLLLVGLVFSGSRNSLILAVGLLLFFGVRKLSAPRLVAVSLLFLGVVVIAALAGLFSSEAITNFAASGSYTHRIAAYGAFGQLLGGQSLAAAVIGNGYGSTQRLFNAGLLQTDGFNVVDNQFVLMLSQGGLVALVTFSALCVESFFGRNWLWRGAVVVVVANSLIFDWFSWPSCSSLGLFCLGAALASTHRGAEAEPVAADPVTDESTTLPFRPFVSTHGK